MNTIRLDTDGWPLIFFSDLSIIKQLAWIYASTVILYYNNILHSLHTCTSAGARSRNRWEIKKRSLPSKLRISLKIPTRKKKTKIARRIPILCYRYLQPLTTPRYNSIRTGLADFSTFFIHLPHSTEYYLNAPLRSSGHIHSPIL